MCSPYVMAVVNETLTRRGLVKRAGATAALLGAGIAAPHIVQAQATPMASPAAPAAPTPVPVAFGAFTTMQDLTHTHGPDFPMFLGAMPMEIDTIFQVVPDGFYKNILTFDEHTGTHLDAPAHFVEDGVTGDQLPIGNFVVPIAVIDISDRAATDADTQLTPDDILAWEAANGPLPENALVAMYSGWEARLVDPPSYVNADADGVQHYPGFHPEAAELLVSERSIAGIAVDTLSQDYGASTDFATHVTILGAGKYGLENVAGLGTIPPVGATVVIGGPKHVAASGGPSRLYAFY